MHFARRVFRIAGIYGIVALFPQYFGERMYGRDYPPPITHPEHYYGFLGVALAWQVAFLMIATDPIRHRPLILAGVLEKLAFGLPALALILNGRSPAVLLPFASIDLVLGILFFAAYRATAPAAGPANDPADPNPVRP